MSTDTDNDNATPRTDAIDDPHWRNYTREPIALCRQLERENNRLRREQEALQQDAILALWLVNNVLNESQLACFYEPDGQAVRYHSFANLKGKR